MPRGFYIGEHESVRFESIRAQLNRVLTFQRPLEGEGTKSLSYSILLNYIFTYGLL